MSDSAPSRVLEFRYDLYSRAHDALQNPCGANELLRLHARALGCRRAAEMLDLAEQQVDAGFGPLEAQHLGSRLGDCADCVRGSCLRPQEIDAGALATSRARSREGSDAGSYGQAGARLGAFPPTTRERHATARGLEGVGPHVKTVVDLVRPRPAV